MIRSRLERFLFLRTKIIFGTGDHLRAVTMTANRGFVRAASQQVSHSLPFDWVHLISFPGNTFCCLYS